MAKYIRQFAAPAVIGLALLVGACRADRDDLASDTGLAGDLTLAGQDTGAMPGLTDVPAGTGPTTQPRQTRTTTPRTTTGGNVATRGTGTAERPVTTVPAGTSLRLASNSRVCTNTNKVGDRFTARTTEAIAAGGVTIPAGATATIEITNLRRSDNVNDPIVMSFRVIQLTWGGTSYPVVAEVTSADVQQVRTSTTRSDAQKVVGGAVIGAIAGQVLGRDTRSTVTGAAAGAAAGTAVAMATGDHEGCINEGGVIAIRLTQAVQVQAE